MNTFKGLVKGGGKLATKLGFPTANIPLTDDSLSGIYAARVNVLGAAYEAVVYVNTQRKLIEAHLLDFTGDLYDKEIEVTLLQKVRGDETFAGEAAARDAISRDVAQVRAYFKK